MYTYILLYMLWAGLITWIRAVNKHREQHCYGSCNKLLTYSQFECLLRCVYVSTVKLLILSKGSCRRSVLWNTELNIMMFSYNPCMTSEKIFYPYVQPIQKYNLPLGSWRCTENWTWIPCFSLSSLQRKKSHYLAVFAMASVCLGQLLAEPWGTSGSSDHSPTLLWNQRR